jgi:starch synthase (maltosyl-transferring)
VNLDPHRTQATMVHVPLDRLRLAADEPFTVTDLLSGVAWEWRGARNYVRLDPAVAAAHVFRLDRRP